MVIELSYPKNQMNYILYFSKQNVDYAPVNAPSNEYL